MNKRIVIIVLLFMQFVVPSCVKVEVSPRKDGVELPLPIFTWPNTDEEDIPANIDMYFARTVNTYHYFKQYPLDFLHAPAGTEVDLGEETTGEADVNDGEEDLENGDEGNSDEGEEDENVSPKNVIYSGDYHVVAFATSSSDKYQIKNASEFLFDVDHKEEWSGKGLTDLYAELPFIDDNGEDVLITDLFGSGENSNIRVVPASDHAWIGVTQKEFQYGTSNPLELEMWDVSQKLTITLSLVNKSPDVAVEGVAVAVIGVASQISLLDRTISALDRTLPSDNQEGTNSNVGRMGVGRILLKLNQEGDVQHGEESDRYTFTGETRTLGIMAPVNNEDLVGYGVLEVAVLMTGSEKPTRTRINLGSILQETPSLSQVDVTDTYRIVRTSNNAPIKLELNLARFKTIYVESSQKINEDSAAMNEWVLETVDGIDNGEISIIPEDPEE